MPKILHISCPKCGGTLGLSGLDRVVKCRFCGTSSLVEAPDHVAEYTIKPVLDAITVRREIQRLLQDPRLPDGLLEHTRFHSARLYFIPYHEVDGRRLGTMRTVQRREPPEDRFSGLSGRLSVTITRSYVGSGRVEQEPAREEVDTRVIMADIHRIDPAIALPEWGIEEAEIGRLRSDPAGVLQPMDRQAMESMGKVYGATIAPEQILNHLKTAPMVTVQDDTELCEVKVKRVFYPVWRVRYRYQNRLYGATVDGVTGKIMVARAPQDDRTRVRWLLGTTALVSFFVGKIVRGVVIGALASRLNVGVMAGLAIYSVAFIPFLLVGLALALLVLGMGWEQFRYEGDVVIAGDATRLVKIGRPEKTIFERGVDLISERLGHWNRS